MERYALVGHSYVRRSFEFCRHPLYQNFNLDSARVYFVGEIDGNKISYVHQVEDWVRKYWKKLKELSLVCLEIGSNDILSYLYYIEPIAIAEKVFQIAKDIRHAGVPRVVIMQILNREGKAALPRWMKNETRPYTIWYAQESYNMAVRAYNRHISYLCRMGDGTIVFRRQRGLHRVWGSRLIDGLHLGKAGQVIWWKNMRSVMISQGLKTRTY